MYKCPECGELMIWQSDNDDGEYTYSFYVCDNCNIDLIKYWNNEGEILDD